MRKEPFPQYPKNFLDVFLFDASKKILLQKKLKKSRINSTISDSTSERFLEFVKRNHNGVVKGTYSYELERAMMFYLQFFDV
jgi:hypothetical protein